MKNLQKIKRLKLKNDHPRFVAIYGIVSSDHDYKLTQALNKKFHIFLKSTSPVIIKDDETDLSFSRFIDTSKAPEIIFSLISNRSGRNFLLKKLKNIDYIFHVEDASAHENKDILSSSLKEIESVTAVFNIDSLTLKDKYLSLIIH
jgi:hypothetical protein